MNHMTAIGLLQKAAIRPHFVAYAGEFKIVDTFHSCSRVETDGPSTEHRINILKACTCGADKHNEVIMEALDFLMEERVTIVNDNE